MIRASLEKAIKHALQSHVYLDPSDFVRRKYENDDHESCYSVSYRHNRIYSFVLEMKKPGAFHVPFHVKMNPGRSSSQETVVLDDQFALLRELKDWEQRLHEDAGVFPIRRQLQLHVSGIDRMRERLALMPGESAQLENRSDFLGEIHRWQLRLCRFISAMQESRRSVVIGIAKKCLKNAGELKAALGRLQPSMAVAEESLEAISREFRVLIEAAISDKTQISMEQWTLLPDAEFLPLMGLCEKYSSLVRSIRDTVLSMPADVFAERVHRDELLEALNSCIKDRQRDVRTLQSYCEDEIPAKMKRHLVEVEKMRQRIEMLPDNSWTADEIARFRDVLEQIRKEVNALLRVDEAEKKDIADRISRMLRSDHIEKQSRLRSTIEFLEEKVRAMESTSLKFLDEMMDPEFMLDQSSAWKETAVLRSIENRMALIAVVDILKKEMESAEKFRTILKSPT